MSPEDAAKKLRSFLGLDYLAPASVINLDMDQASPLVGGMSYPKQASRPSIPLYGSNVGPIK